MSAPPPPGYPMTTQVDSQPQQYPPPVAPTYPMVAQPYPQPYAPQPQYPPGTHNQGPQVAPGDLNPVPPNLPRESFRTTCPNCQQIVDTETRFAMGAASVVAVLLLVGLLCCLCAWIPCVCKSCKDVEHKCPSCGWVIGRSFAGNVRPGHRRRAY